MGDGSWTVYIGGIYEKRSNGTYVKYYSVFGRRIAMRDNAGVVHYVLADHLGSSTVITNSAGAVVGTMKYYPYGAERSVTGDMITDKLFTGQQREPEGVSTLGLYDYGARFYSTLVGRFVSPDPLFTELNAYSYAGNNPLRYVDPMGLCFTMPDGTTLDCNPNLWLDILDCALGSCVDYAPEGVDAGDLQTLCRAGIQQEEFWNHAWEYVYDDIGWAFVGVVVNASLYGGGPTMSTPESGPALDRDRIAGVLNLIPAHGWNTMGGIFGVPGDFFHASLYDMIAGTATIADLDPDFIISAYPWWRNEGKGQTIERLYGLRWNELGSDLEDVLIWVTKDLAKGLQAAGEDLNDRAWSDWQKELLHKEYGVNLPEPYRGAPPPCVWNGTCLGPYLPPFIR